jgi:TetR/AcrR family transcriptional regulator, cholesterol catabolism regulator
MEQKPESILLRVSKMYRRYGIKSVTMDDVAKHLGISKKTLYGHYRDKEDLVKKVLMKEHERQLELFTEIETLGLNAIEEFFEAYKLLKDMFREYHPSMEYDLRKYYPDLYFKVREIRRKRIYESSYRNMNKGKKEGLYRADLNSRIIAKLHVLRIETLFDTDLFTLEEVTTFKVFHEIFMYHLNGIMSVEGRAFFSRNLKKFRDICS